MAVNFIMLKSSYYIYFNYTKKNNLHNQYSDTTLLKKQYQFNQIHNS